jgi:hypothetical protein
MIDHVNVPQETGSHFGGWLEFGSERMFRVSTAASDKPICKIF